MRPNGVTVQTTLSESPKLASTKPSQSESNRPDMALFISSSQSSAVKVPSQSPSVAKIVDGVIYNTNKTVDAYNIPNELIAKRIAENSGDYIVKPYTANFELDSENTHLLLKVSDGVAVVDGFRAARDFPTTIRLEIAFTQISPISSLSSLLKTVDGASSSIF